MIIDLKDSVRALRAARGSTAAALMLLTIGIGASTAIFSVVDAVLRGLPFADADRLVVVAGTSPRTGTPLNVPPQDYLDWRARQDVFEDLAAAEPRTDLLVETGTTDPMVRMRATANLFSVLGVLPRLGRGFSAEHEVAGSHRVLVLSDAVWRRRFGADPAVVGRTITFDNETFEILGVMPPGFTYPLGAARPTDLYTPYVVSPSQRVRGRSRSFALEVIGRLKSRISVADARARMEQHHHALAAEFPDWFTGRGIAVTDLRESIVGPARPWMRLLAGAVAFLLLLVCVNVSGLALARGLARASDIGIRAALGATRARIVRIIVLENVILSVAGACGGALLAYGGVSVLRAALPASVPRVASIAVDARVLAAAAAAAVVTALICSVVPAVRFSRRDVVDALRYGRPSGGAGQRSRAGGRWLVMAEASLAIVLLVGAGLFVSSFVRVTRVDLGLDYRNVLTVPAQIRFRTFAERTQAAERAAVMLPAVLERVRGIPGVDAAAAISGGVPLSGASIRSTLQVRGRATQLDDEVVDVHHVSADYFTVLGIPLIEGRLLSERDARDAPKVVVLSDAAARKYFPGGDALGSVAGFELETDFTVVGVVGNLRLDGPERPVRPEAYIPLAQGVVTGADLVVRTTVDPLSVAPAVKAAIWSIDPGVVIPDALPLATRLDAIIAPRKFNMLLFGLLGLVAMAIAATGIYAVLAQQVQQQSAELGLRLALGATPRQILHLVMGRAARDLAAGLGVGIVGASMLAGFVETFLFEMTPRQPVVYAGAALVLLLAGLLAALTPALRAMRTDPLRTLRS